MTPDNILRAMRNLLIDFELSDDKRAGLIRAAYHRLLELETTYAKLSATDMGQFWNEINGKGA